MEGQEVQTLVQVDDILTLMSIEGGTKKNKEQPFFT